MSNYLIHGTGADVPSYRAAIDGALIVKRFLLIETSSSYVRLWGEALITAHVPFLALEPTDGMHPALPAKARMQ